VDKVKVIPVLHDGRRVAVIEANWASVEVRKEIADEIGIIPDCYRKVGLEGDTLEFYDGDKATKAALVRECAESLEDMFPEFHTELSYGRVKTYREEDYWQK
jgi:Asp/Glu/hydantoin racemase